MSRLSPEQLAWVNSRPPKVRKIALAYPATQCYRATDNRGHYTIYCYSEPRSKYGRVTVKLIHGQDSYLPGVMVFGVNPKTLIPCDCGKWNPPTIEDCKQRKLERSDGTDTN